MEKEAPMKVERNLSIWRENQEKMFDILEKVVSDEEELRKFSSNPQMYAQQMGITAVPQYVKPVVVYRPGLPVDPRAVCVSVGPSGICVSSGGTPI